MKHTYTNGMGVEVELKVSVDESMSREELVALATSKGISCVGLRKSGVIKALRGDKRLWPSLSSGTDFNKSECDCLWPSLTNRIFEKSEGDSEQEQLQKTVSIFKTKTEFIVCGVVYSPGSPEDTDAQGDYTDEIEIKKAAYSFMENSKQTFKVNHQNKTVAKVLESYVTPTEFEVGGQVVKKGSWVITLRILSKKVWEMIEKGELQGFSMGGSARKG